MLEGDFSALLDLGLHPLFRFKQGTVFARSNYKNIGVARLLANCQAGQNVRYINGDPLDLRQQNLLLLPGMSLYAARSLLKKSLSPLRYELKSQSSVSLSTLLQAAWRKYVTHLLSDLGSGDAVSYRFSHALVQESTGSAGPSRYRIRTANMRVLRSSDRAVAWWRRAGQRNAQASANIEAIAHFEQCLELLARLPNGRERDISHAWYALVGAR
jgi:hypothetical protein